MESGKRVTWVDTAKGWGMLAIILSHVMTGHPVSWWLYTFHVPLFFFLSGFLFRADRPWGDFWKGKLQKLLLPYFALALPIIPAEAALAGTSAGFWERVGEMSLGVLVQRRLWPIWFLACLFLLEILAYRLLRLVKKPVPLALTAAAMGAVGVLYAKAGLPVLPWNLDACFGVMPFFVGGYLLKDSPKALSWLQSGKTRPIAFGLLTAGNLVVAFTVVKGMTAGMDVFKNQYGSPLWSYFGAFCGIGAVLLASQWITAKPIRYLGRNSLIYFVWHQTPVITAIYVYFPKLGIPMENFPNRLAMLGEKGLELALILLVLTLLNELLLRSRFRWALGR